MPRLATNYSRTVIYKIQHEMDEALLYVGSTTDFTKRKCEHKSMCNNENGSAYNRKLYKMIRENGGWDAFTITIIHEFPCDNKQQALTEEDRVMRSMRCTMNSVSAYTGLTTTEYKKQYHIDHKIEQNELSKQYYIDNKIEYSKKKSVQIECTCGSNVSKRNISTHRKTPKHTNFILAQEPSGVHV